MDNTWTIVVIVAVALPLFLLLRWLTVRRAITQARRRRDGQRG